MIGVDLFESEFDEIYDFLHNLRNTEFHKDEELKQAFVLNDLKDIIKIIQKTKPFLNYDSRTE